MIELTSRINGPGLNASLIAKSPGPGPSVDAGGTFADMIGKVAQEGVSALRQGEASSLSGIAGKLPVQDVVQTVMSAERSLQTAIAVRDKLVAAWQDVSRMSI